MAWTAPATYAVSEVVTAAKLNTHVRDNLLYLKGSSGPVSIDNTIASLIAAGGASVEAQGTSNNSNARFRLLAKQSGGTVVDYRIFANALSADGELAIYDATAGAERLRISAGGNVGINQAVPQGRLHVNDAIGGVVRLSASAVTTVQTLLVAGTIARCAVCWIMDINNTGNVVVGVPALQIALGANNTYVNNDTISVAITAGGALTVTRSAGTNGTHTISMLCQYI